MRDRGPDETVSPAQMGSIRPRSGSFHDSDRQRPGSCERRRLRQSRVEQRYHRAAKSIIENILRRLIKIINGDLSMGYTYPYSEKIVVSYG